MCAVIACGLLSAAPGKTWSRGEKNKVGDRGNEMAFVAAHSLLLSPSAALSARLVRTPASHSPAGAPPSSASRAGTPRSCRTCGA